MDEVEVEPRVGLGCSGVWLGYLILMRNPAGRVWGWDCGRELEAF